MGTWGAGLFQNDNTADLKADFKLWVGMPWDQDRLLAELTKHYSINPDAPCEEADESGFWLAVMDLFHQYGLDHPLPRAKALELIENGTDLRLLEAEEMEPADLRRRAKLLETLVGKWATPAKSPKKIKPLKKEPLLLAEGDLVAYPTMNWSARAETLYIGDSPASEFKPDATNVFVVLATQHVFHDMFARYCIAPLLCFHGPGEPNLDDVGAPPKKWSEIWDMNIPFSGGPENGSQTRKTRRHRIEVASG